MLLGGNDAYAKNLAILHLPGRSVLADVYDAVPNLFQQDRIDCILALAVNGSFDHRRISAAHLIREAEHWIARRSCTAVTAQLARNFDRLQAGLEIGERPSRYPRRRSRS